MLNEKFFRALFFVVIVSAGVYYFYPTELNEAQRLAYLKSYGVTLGLTIGGTAIGVTLGFILAFLKFLNIKILSFLIDEYVDILRGTPIILQLLIFSVVIFATWSDNFYVALIALGLNSSAYVAEIVRSGINSVDKGQMEAARAMGLNYYVSMREVVFPQATKTSCLRLQTNLSRFLKRRQSLATLASSISRCKVRVCKRCFIAQSPSFSRV